MRLKPIDTGRVFERLTVTGRAPKEVKRKNETGAHWWVKCECGKKFAVAGNQLRTGRVKSCGCLKRDKNIARFLIHGHARYGKAPTRTYYSWVSMRDRCYNVTRDSYLGYGAKGITVCDRWRFSFANFLADMGERPLETSLDRIDSLGNYELGNCRWATRQEQADNTRKHKCLANWTDEELLGELNRRNLLLSKPLR